MSDKAVHDCTPAHLPFKLDSWLQQEPLSKLTACDLAMCTGMGHALWLQISKLMLLGNFSK